MSGFVLVFRMGSSEVVSGVPTIELAAFLALMVFPGLCLWTFLADRTARDQAVQPQPEMAESSGEIELRATTALEEDAGVLGAEKVVSPGIEMVQELDWPEHDAHARPPGDRHRRRTDVAARREFVPGVRRAG